jgi:hypothetical protein
MRPSPRSIRSVPLALWCVLAAVVVSPFALQPVRSDATSIATPRAVDSLTYRDPIARLQAQLDNGTITLTHDSAHGYLASLLRTLEIPVSSQGLVFSRTSLQTDKIAPWTPRALYFNDDVYIGFVQESSFLEVASMDPVRGAVFYTLSQEPRGRPRFSRETTTCLMCHQSRAATGGVPGLMVLSTISDRFGYPVVGVHEGVTTDATPIRQRFGGWYVTGTHGDSAVGGHSGNVYSPRLGHEITDKQAYRTVFDATKESARKDVSDKFDPSPYLSTQGDIVALMVLVHQTIVHNLITTVHEAVREVQSMVPESLDSSRSVAVANTFGEAPSAVRLQGTIDRLAKALVFADEARLRGSMRGTTSFTDDFSRRGPRDHLGRSLRDFDLSTKLFKYPISFLVYSDGVTSLPQRVRHEIYRQLDAALRPADGTDSSRVSRADRETTLSIITETSADFRAYRAAIKQR